MSGLDESGIVLSAMLEAEIEAVDSSVVTIIAEAKSAVIREKEKENNEIWKEKMAVRKSLMNHTILYDRPSSVWADSSTTGSKYYYIYNMGTGNSWNRWLE